MRIAIVGGDARMPFVAAALERAGHRVGLSAACGRALSPSMLAEAEAVLLPHPLTRDGIHLNAPASPLDLPLSALFAMLPEGVPLLCGHTGGALAALAESHPLLSYGEDEGYLSRGATLTAEGALPLLLGRGGVALSDTPCLILGSGRLASALSDLLTGLHAPFAVAARRTTPLPCGICPHPLESIASIIGGYPVILNTVPVRLLTPQVLSCAARGTLILELSAVPGVLDTELCARLGLEVTVAPALPGRYAPKSAGEALAAAAGTLLC